MPWRTLEPSEEVLNQFIVNVPSTSYLQSWQWGVFQQSLGRTVRRQLWLDGSLPVAAITFIHQPLPVVGGYGYIPKGPVITPSLLGNQALWREITAWVRQYQRDHKLIFTQLEPPTEHADVATTIQHLGWHTAPGIQPAHTQVVDLRLDENALLGAMHSKTRYNIGLAQRKGVSVLWHGPEALKDFWRLVQETNQRDRITSFSSTYYAAMMQAFGNNARLAAASYDGTILAMNLLIMMGDTVTYAHGGSTSHQRALMAPQLLQWETIRWAKQNGYHYYDFRGIAPTDAPSHPWAGITRFKKGFGGTSIHQIGAFDLINRPLLYWLYRRYRRGSR